MRYKGIPIHHLGYGMPIIAGMTTSLIHSSGVRSKYNRVTSVNSPRFISCSVASSSKGSLVFMPGASSGSCFFLFFGFLTKVRSLHQVYFRYFAQHVSNYPIYGNISVESGARTWQLFAQSDVQPIIVSEGDKLFSHSARHRLQLVGSRTYENGVVGLHYRK
jgi:hypothetical protein